MERYKSLFKEQSNYGFEDFLMDEDISPNDYRDIAEAIVGWGANWVMGENEGDFETVALYAKDKKVWNLIKHEASELYLKELRKYIR